MKKILLVTTRYPYPAFGGDKNRFIGIAKSLADKNQVDIVCFSNKDHNEKHSNYFFNNIKIFKINIFIRILYSFFFLLKMKPMQIGFYYSKKMKEYINNIGSNYNSIVFHGIRSAQYCPKLYKGKSVLEMTDLMSLNFKIISNAMPFYNFFKYIYIIESFLIKKYENYISDYFNKIILISKNDLNLSRNVRFKKKIIIVKSGVIFKEKIFEYNKKNFKIIFIGNIQYYPNKLACHNFSKRVLPILSKKIPNIEFHIIGKINYFDKLILGLNKNIKIHGPIDNINKILKYSICGINNVNIGTGFQTKVLTYMSYGLPVLSVNNYETKNNFINNKEILYYNDNDQLIKKILLLKNNKKISENISINSIIAIKKKFDWKKNTIKYTNLI
jgi:glycosyltransferase involved in cell wall biosynthesis